MALSKVKIGAFVELHNEACGIPNLTVYDVSGVNRDKEFFEPSKQVGANTNKYKVVPPDYFACNLMHIGRDVVLPVALNHSGHNKYVSPAYTVFRIKDETVILKEYFFILLNSEERDRYFWFHTDSSVRDGMEWAVFCDVELEIPDVTIQKKYVDIYWGMQENLNAMTCSIDQMQKTCAFLMEHLKKSPVYRLGDQIEQVREQNVDGRFDITHVRGVSNTKQIQLTKANINTRDLTNFLIIRKGQFVFNRRTTRNGERLGLGYNDTDEIYIFTNDYVAFQLKADSAILPDYLYMLFKRDEFDRYVRYNSWGSATEFFNWEDMQDVHIPVPDMKTQRNVVTIANALKARTVLTDKLRATIKTICPILIRGAIEEGGR